MLKFRLYDTYNIVLCTYNICMYIEYVEGMHWHSQVLPPPTSNSMHLCYAATCSISVLININNI